jgi:predicted AAA+ superfamily ATPase
MKQVIGEILREFYENGVPSDVKVRHLDFVEKKRTATVVIGMRRTGKTYVTYRRIQELLDKGIGLERIVQINFDDERLRGFKVDDLRLIGEVHAEMFPDAVTSLCWYFLDELQNIDGWEKYARRLLESSRVQLCLTGSSSKLLSKEIATEMRGRSLEIEVFTLSFSEFLLFNGVFTKIPVEPFSLATAGRIRNAFSRYFEVGGFPDVQNDLPRFRTKILQEYVDAVVYRDIIERHDITSVQSLRYTLDYILSNYARKVSVRAISGVLKNLGFSDNRENIADYLSYLSDAYLIYPVSLRTDSLAVRRTNPDKYYVIDVGLLRAMKPNTERDRGWMLENLVFMMLRRRDNRIEYYLTNRGEEVDFIVTDKITGQRRLIQVAWDLSDERTVNRETSALANAAAEMGVDSKTIITWDLERSMDGGIEVVPIWKWALQEGV